MNPRTGLLLRLLGPLIEIICLILLMRVRDQGRTVLGIPAEYPLYAGLALGLALVIVGLTFSRPATRRPRDPG
ncbi:hypothetical protein P12x_004820 [Tundrisphaera lichenicola]|uniref:hypothetical protein n=1 Tax=Tundrisphaera lichenicola TaxID=2029860 RepID=UPI003EBDC0F2